MNTSFQPPGHYDSTKRQRIDVASSGRIATENNINNETIQGSSNSVDNLPQNCNVQRYPGQRNDGYWERKRQRKKEKMKAEKELLNACLQREPGNVNFQEIANSLGKAKALEVTGVVDTENITSEKKCRCDFSRLSAFNKVENIPKNKLYKQKCNVCKLIKRCKCELREAGELDKFVKGNILLETLRFRYLDTCKKCKTAKLEKKFAKRIEKFRNKEKEEYTSREDVTLDPEDEEEICSLLEEAKQIQHTEKKTSGNEEQSAFIKLINNADTRKHIRETDLQQDSSLDCKLIAELKMKEADKTNTRYQTMLDFRRKLPAYEMKETLLQLIQNNQVTLVSGPPGCGKTTQVAQYILDDYIMKGIGSTCRIICTQPRSISSTSVSERVASERDEPLGNSTGYITRLENKAPRRTGSMLFCTIGVLLKFIIFDSFLVKASHIIIDDIHERDTPSDFLLIILKEILPYRPDLRIILMSATLNAELFSQYFNACPTLDIPGYTYPVKELYLEDILEKVPFTNTKPKKTLSVSEKKKTKEKGELDFQAYVDSIESSYSRGTIDHLRTIDFNVISYELVLAVVRYICNTTKEGAILIFLPGWEDISQMMDILKDKYGKNNKFIITAIHSKLSSVSQKEIFNPAPQGFRKIVVGTHIAETSITINDIVYVIDCGRTIENRYNSNTNISSLETVWVSKASSKQRSGRAGRVQPGQCYHLFTKHHETLFDEYQIPEMLRICLDPICLQVKILKFGNIRAFLSKAINPPPVQSCRYAIKDLHQMGAIDENENLTSLGYYIAHLPVASNIGKMILTGAMLSCLDPILTIAACLELADIFTSNCDDNIRLETKLAAGDAKSDHLMLLNIFQKWEKIKDYKERMQHCRENFLSTTNLNMVVGMKMQYSRYLKEIGFISFISPKDKLSNMNSNNTALIKAVVCAGLYPNVAKVTAQSKYPKDKNSIDSISIASINRNKLPLTIHRQSVNHGVKDFESQWLVYHKKMKDERFFIYDTTMISPYPLIFFGGSVSYEKQDEVDTIVVDKLIKFKCSARTAQIIIDLRKKLDDLYIEKINNTTVSIMAGETSESSKQKIFQAIIGLISSKKIISKTMCQTVDLDPVEDTAALSDSEGTKNIEKKDGADDSRNDGEDYDSCIVQVNIPPDDSCAKDNTEFKNNTDFTTKILAAPESQKTVFSSAKTLNNTVNIDGGLEINLSGNTKQSSLSYERSDSNENECRLGREDTRNTAIMNVESDQGHDHTETHESAPGTKNTANRNIESNQYHDHRETYENTLDTRNIAERNTEYNQYRDHRETYESKPDTRNPANRNIESNQYCDHRETDESTLDTRNIAERIESDQYRDRKETYESTLDTRNTANRNIKSNQYRDHIETYQSTPDTRHTANRNIESNQYCDHRETYESTLDTRNIAERIESDQYRDHRETYENTLNIRNTAYRNIESDQHRDSRETYENTQDTRKIAGRNIAGRNIEYNQYRDHREDHVH